MLSGYPGTAFPSPSLYLGNVFACVGFNSRRITQIFLFLWCGALGKLWPSRKKGTLLTEEAVPERRERHVKRSRECRDEARARQDRAVEVVCRNVATLRREAGQGASVGAATSGKWHPREDGKKDAACLGNLPNPQGQTHSMIHWRAIMMR